MEQVVVALVTVEKREEAVALAKALVEERLVACVNLVPTIESLYWWEGEVQQDSEVLLVIKTREGLAKTLVARVKELHSYEVPEVILLPVVEGNPDYLEWVRTETTRRGTT